MVNIEKNEKQNRHEQLDYIFACHSIFLMHFFLYTFSEDDLTPHLKAVQLLGHKNLIFFKQNKNLILRPNSPLHHANYTNNQFYGQNTRMYIKISNTSNNHCKLITRKLQNDRELSLSGILAKIKKPMQICKCPKFANVFYTTVL